LLLRQVIQGLALFCHLYDKLRKQWVVFEAKASQAEYKVAQLVASPHGAGIACSGRATERAAATSAEAGAALPVTIKAPNAEAKLMRDSYPLTLVGKRDGHDVHGLLGRPVANIQYLSDPARAMAARIAEQFPTDVSMSPPHRWHLAPLSSSIGTVKWKTLIKGG
jgi:4-hydroxy-3-methylbut-2-enyl diphosphate reductase IspH